jgi:hypothetical protein
MVNPAVALDLASEPLKLWWAFLQWVSVDPNESLLQQVKVNPLISEEKFGGRTEKIHFVRGKFLLALQQEL